MLAHSENAASRARMHIDRLRDRQQFHAREDAAERRARHRLRDVVGAEHVHIARLIQHDAPFNRLLLEQRDLILVVRGLYVQRQLARGEVCGAVGDPLADYVELQ